MDLVKFNGKQRVDPADILNYLQNFILPALGGGGGGGGGDASAANQAIQTQWLTDLYAALGTEINWSQGIYGVLQNIRDNSNQFQTVDASTAAKQDISKAVLDQILAYQVAIRDKLTNDPATAANQVVEIARLTTLVNALNGVSTANKQDESKSILDAIVLLITGTNNILSGDIAQQSTLLDLRNIINNVTNQYLLDIKNAVISVDGTVGVTITELQAIKNNTLNTVILLNDTVALRSKQDEQTAFLNAINTKVATAVKQDTQIANDNTIITKMLTGGQGGSLWDTIAFGAVKGGSSTTGTLIFNNTFNSRIGGVLSYFLNGASVTRSIDTAICTKIIAQIRYQSVNGLDAIITFNAGVNAVYNVAVPFKTMDGAVVNSIAIPKNTVVLVLLEIANTEFMYCKMNALPTGFVVGTDRIELNYCLKL